MEYATKVRLTKRLDIYQHILCSSGRDNVAFKHIPKELFTCIVLPSEVSVTHQNVISPGNIHLSFKLHCWYSAWL